MKQQRRNAAAAAPPASAKKARKKKCRFRGTDHHLSVQEFNALCAASTPPYDTMWRLIVSHGLRISECLALRASDVADGFLTLQRLKGSERTRQKLLVDLSEFVAAGTYRLFTTPGGGGMHRSTAYLHFRRACAKAGIDRARAHPHCLKHTTAVWLLKANVPLHVASRFLGHASIASTAQYLNCSDESASELAAPILGAAIMQTTAVSGES